MALTPDYAPKPSHLSGPVRFALAVIGAILGSFFSSLALVFMKWAHLRRDGGPQATSGRPRSILKSPLWWGGFLMIGIGNVCNIAALNYGNQFLLSTTCCISVIFNTIFCVLLLKEKLYLIRLVALVVICVGASLFLGLGQDVGGEPTLDAILALYARPISVLYIAIIVTLISCFFITNFKIQRRLEQFYTKCWTLSAKSENINAS